MGSRNLKPATTTKQQIAILKARNMLVDEVLASQWLQFVGYYRLSAYWYPARQIARDGLTRMDSFLPGTKFSDVVHLYEADRKLRTLVYDGMERIEIAVRALVTDTVCLGPVNDPRAYLDADRFRPTFNHIEWLSTIYGRLNREFGRSEPLKHYADKYGKKFPLWVVAESMDFRDASQLYGGLNSEEQFKVAEKLGISIRYDQLSSNQQRKVGRRHPWANWLEQLTVIRNTCAHHGRLWNRSFTPASTAALRTNPAFAALPSGQNERIFGALVVMSRVLRNVSPGTTWPNKIGELLKESFLDNPLVERSSLGMPDGWDCADL